MKIAHDCLIRAIYRNESALSVNDVINKYVSHHCEFVSTKQNVVPFAILLACGLSMEQAMIRFTLGKVFSGLKYLIKKQVSSDHYSVAHCLKAIHILDTKTSNKSLIYF